MRSISVLALVAMTMACPLVARGEEIASGLRSGEHPEPLQVRDCTGPAAGKTLCYTCRYAERPTIAIFTHQLTPETAQLVKRIDSELDKRRAQRPAAYVVIIGEDNAELEAALKGAAKEHDLRHVPLTILRDRPAKLAAGYRLAQDAALTVTQWREGTVTSSRGFASSELTDADIERVLADVDNLLSDK
jgi:hypothetical protein